MIAYPYDTPEPYTWVVRSSMYETITSAGPFTDDADAAAQLAARRKAFPGHVVVIFKDGQVWEPGQ